MTSGDRDALREDIDTLNHLVDCGNETTADRLAEIAAEQKDVHALQRLVDEGSGTAETLLDRVIREIT